MIWSSCSGLFNRYRDALLKEANEKRQAILDEEAAKQKEREEAEKERLAEKAEMEEEARQEARARKLEIAEQEWEEELRLQEERNQAEAEAAQKQADVITNIERGKQKAIQNITDTANNLVENAYRKRFDRLEKQFKSGAITEEEYEKRKEILQKNQAIKQWKVERAAFIVNQIQRAGEAAMDTAKAITSSVAAFPLTGGQPWASIAAGIGITQGLAIATTPPPPRPSFREGGMVVQGPSHEQGGIPIHVGGNYVGEMEGNEGLFVTSRAATQNMLNDYNTGAGGRSMFGESFRFAQDGGQIDTTPVTVTPEMIAEALAQAPSPVIEASSFMAAINEDMKATDIGTV